MIHQFASRLEHHFQRAPLAMQKQYGDHFVPGVKVGVSHLTEGCWNPENVVNAMVHAVTAIKPRVQYLVSETKHDSSTSHRIPLPFFLQR